jgi:hypothetical protein
MRKAHTVILIRSIYLNETQAHFPFELKVCTIFAKIIAENKICEISSTSKIRNFAQMEPAFSFKPYSTYWTVFQN